MVKVFWLFTVAPALTGPKFRLPLRTTVLAVLLVSVAVAPVISVPKLVNFAVNVMSVSVKLIRTTETVA